MKFIAAIVVPCHNCEKTLSKTFVSLSNQSEKRFELVIIDDGSTDGALELAKKLSKKLKLGAKIFSQKNQGPAVARNFGAKRASAPIVVFLDSDCVCPENWLKELLVPLKKGFTACSCPYKTANTHNWVARYVGYEIGQRQDEMLGKSVDVAASYSFAIKRKEFLELGGFDTSFRTASGEDFDFCFKLVAKNKKIFFTSKTFVWHHHPESLWRYIRQQFKRGYWRVPMYFKNTHRATKKESYVGFQPQAQFVLTNLVMFSAIVSIVLLNPLPFAIFAVILYVSNLDLGLWCWGKEKKFVLLAPLIASIRSMAALFGVYKFFFDKAFK